MPCVEDLVVWNADVDVYYALAFLGENLIDCVLEADEGEFDELRGVEAFAHLGDERAEGGVLDGLVGEE